MNSTSEETWREPGNPPKVLSPRPLPVRLALDQQRCRLVDELRSLGIQDENVLKAMLAVPREEFITEEFLERAYQNVPLPIGFDQTISQPFIVACMAEALELQPADRVLEIGAGSGYAAAILSQIVAHVFAIERLAELAADAATRLRTLGYDNVELRHGDGTFGWPEEAPFDGIIVSAASSRIPTGLFKQLRVGGRLVIPLGDDRDVQQLVRITRRSEEQFDRKELGAVRFVPLIGEAV